MAQGQLVEVLEQQRHAVGAGGGDRERIEPRLGGGVAQDPRAQAGDAEHPQLLVGLGEGVLQRPAKPVGAALGLGEHQHRLGGHPPGDQADEARQQGVGLAGAGAAD